MEEQVKDVEQMRGFKPYKGKSKQTPNDYLTNHNFSFKPYKGKSKSLLHSAEYIGEAFQTL